MYKIIKMRLQFCIFPCSIEETPLSIRCPRLHCVAASPVWDFVPAGLALGDKPCITPKSLDYCEGFHFEVKMKAFCTLSKDFEGKDKVCPQKMPNIPEVNSEASDLPHLCI